MKIHFAGDAIKYISGLDNTTAGRIFKAVLLLPTSGDIKPLKGVDGVFWLLPDDVATTDDLAAIAKAEAEYKSGKTLAISTAEDIAVHFGITIE